MRGCVERAFREPANGVSFVLNLMEQNRADRKARIRNHRILALPIETRREADLTSAMALPKRLREELEHFFIAATALEGNDPAILGWGSPEEALTLLRSSTD